MIMKRFIGIIAAALMTIFLCISASADIINIGPKGRYEDLGAYRYFLVTSDCKVYDKYDYRNEVAALSKGDIIGIKEIYIEQDGTKMGIYFYDGDHRGYVDMYRTDLIYDHFSFMEEHEDELSDYDGELDDFEPNGQTVLWLSPLSNAYSEIVSEDEWKNGTWLDNIKFRSKIWTDENGGKWAYLGYGAFSWIYLPDPAAIDIPERESYFLASDSKSGADTEVSGVRIENSPDMTIPVILAGAAVIASAVVIFAINQVIKRSN